MVEVIFIESLITFYLKGKVQIDANNIKFADPNTILKVIPLGKKTATIPINQLSSVDDHFALDFKSLLIGAFIAYTGFVLMTQNDTAISGTIVLLFGILQMINAFEIRLLFTQTSGHSRELQFFIFEKDKASKIKEMTEAMMNQRLDDTNYKMVQESTNALLEQILNK